MNSGQIISSLPGYEGKMQLLNKRQTVRDIIREILKAHREFATDYDKISAQFDRPTVRQIAAGLHSFIKNNVRYQMEPESRQTIKSPAAIMAQAYGDCKHYASFIGGVLDALNRRGKKINWRYRFASYSLFNPEPEHIFVIIKTKDGGEIWIDPVPGADKAKPMWKIDKKINVKNSMALYKISGVGELSTGNYLVEDFFDSADYAANPNFYNAIILLYQYGIINKRGEISNRKLATLQSKVDPNIFAQLVNAAAIVQSGAIGGFFDTLWRGVKKVTLFAPRAAYLSLVNINFRGMANKLYKAVYNSDGTYTRYKESIKKLWQDRLGGDWTKLENTIRIGNRKKAILKGMPDNSIGVAETAAAAWYVTAGAIIAAFMPLINAALKALGKDKEPTELEGGGYLDPGNYLDTPQAPASNDPLQFLKDNPLLIVGGVAAVYFLTRKKSA